MKKTLMNAVLFSCLLVATGCATGHQIDYNKVSQIQKNISTEANVISLFGEPSATQINSQTGIKTLMYTYKQDSSFLSSAASATGAIAGGLLANKNIGKGSGRFVSGALGSMVGGYAGRKAVGKNRTAEALKVLINMKTGRVVDFNYIQNQVNQ